MIRSFLLATMAMSIAACATVPESLPFEVKQIPASAETAGMPERGDRADDPAVWVNASAPSRSLILGTNKETGLYVYDLNGSELQFLPVGRLNNIDLRGNIAVGSNDEVNGLSWFVIDAGSASVRHLGDTPVIPAEPYGVCAGLKDGMFYASPTYKDGKVEIWQTAMTDVASLSPTLTRTLQLPGQLEGCVYHEASKRLFIGEEENGIWVLDLSDPAAEPTLFDTIAAGNGLVADVEGLSIWAQADGAQYLVASAQAKDRFVVYDLSTNLPVGIFSVTSSLDGTVDAVTHTDGLDVTAKPLPGFPQGLVVVQDDGNPNPEQNQNFKLVDWSAIANALGL
jgi:3-phytase